MTAKIDFIVSAMMKLHRWREDFNGEYPGLGFCASKPNEYYHYAEAYALWGIGYLALFRITRDQQFLSIARDCGEWLLRNVNPGYGGLPSWGLPWAWKKWGAPARLSYVSTTSFSGDLFLELYKTTEETLHLETAKRVATWLVEENKAERSEDGLWLYYANFPPLRFPIFNAVSKASGFFGSLHNRTGCEFYRSLCLDTARFVIAVQCKDGSWGYSVHHTKTDNTHTAYTLEGLLQGYEILDKDMQLQLHKGLHFYSSALFTPEGKGLARTRYGWKSLGYIPWRSWVKDMLAPIPGFFKSQIPEARLWAYGSALRVFSTASQVDKRWLDRALEIYQYTEKNLALENGAYAHRSEDRQVYIRHEAHFFAGMGYLALAL